MICTAREHHRGGEHTPPAPFYRFVPQAQEGKWVSDATVISCCDIGVVRGDGGAPKVPANGRGNTQDGTEWRGER